MRRSSRLGLVLSISALVVAPAWSAPAQASVTTETKPSLATEVCEDMVGGAIEAAMSAKLPAPPQGAWQGTGKTRYVCTYTVAGGGSISLTVQVLKNTAGAKKTYTAVRAKTTKPLRLNGLGQAAFQAPDGLLVARKDRFVLTIDPAALPSAVAKSDVAFAAVVAVLACWTGEADS